MTRPIHRYTEEEKNYLIENVPTKTTTQVLKDFKQKFNWELTKVQLRNFKGKNKIHSTIQDRNKSRLFTEEQEKYFEENVTTCLLPELLIKFNEHFNTNFTIENFRHYKGRRKLRSGKHTDLHGNQYAKGHKYTKEQRENYEKGLIKRSINRRKKIGYESVSKDGYVRIKVKLDYGANDNFIPRSRYVYEKHYGKLPEKTYIIHLDGNSNNDDINNLRPVSLEEFNYLNANGLLSKNVETNEVAITAAQLYSKAKNKKKEWYSETNNT